MRLISLATTLFQEISILSGGDKALRQIPEIFRITRCRFLAIGLGLLFVVMLAWSATAAKAANDQAGLQSEAGAEASIS